MDVLPDVLKPNLKIVFCGMAAGNRSAELSDYYASVANKFWRTICEIGLTPYKLTRYEHYRILEYKIGLTDLVKDKAGNDCDVSATLDDIQKLRNKIQYYEPLVLAFVGKKAAKIFLGQPSVEYGVQQQMIGQTKVFVLPSTATTASIFFKMSYWEELARITSVGVEQISSHDGTSGLIDALQKGKRKIG